ncbi:MAG: serine hydrolase, partial [Bryobacter sp.]|nr:serine hydrolase [Bryobacter sp.]
LPGFRLADPMANELVTLRDLVSHRTGLSRNDALWYNTLWSREEILARIAAVPLTRSFRSSYQYQNIMFLAAGEAVARRAGGTWEKFVASRILDPLGMNNTGFSPADAQAAPDVAAPHIKRKGVVVEVPWKDITNIGPAGSMNSSVRDLARWVTLHINRGVFEGRRVISEKEIVETHTPQTVIHEDAQAREMNPESHLNVYGLGWRLQDYRGRFLISHGGAIDGFRAQVAFLPDEKWGLVVLTNLGQTTLADALRFALVDVLLDLPRKDWPGIFLAAVKKQEEQAAARRKERIAKRAQGTKPALPLHAYSGAYENPGYGLVVVKAIDDWLTLAWGGHTVRLQHWHYETFESPEDAMPLEQTSVTFRLGKDGDAMGLEFLDQEFKRVKEEGGKK